MMGANRIDLYLSVTTVVDVHPAADRRTSARKQPDHSTVLPILRYNTIAATYLYI